MIRIGLLAVMLTFPLPAAVHAQMGEGRDLGQLLEQFRDDAESFLRGLMGEAESGRQELERRLKELEPHLRDLTDDLARELGGLWQYHPPEMLPNGDIILRRRQPGEVDDSDPAPDEADPAPDSQDDEREGEGDSASPDSEPFEL